MTFTAAVVQLTTTKDVDVSQNNAEALVRAAAGAGASLIALPENVAFMGSEKAKRVLAEPLDGPLFTRWARLAAELKVTLLAGSNPESSEDPNRPFNTSVCWGPAGERLGVYRKIHLFDVALGEGATHTESEAVSAGQSLTIAESEHAKIGMSICYDLRFAAQYRALVRAGAEILTVPAAFTVPTGKDHWQVLLRARAIENQCYVMAPAQFGHNTEGRQTYGRSMIIDPWGTVLATCPDRPSFALATIDLDAMAQLRRKMPCLAHERAEHFKVPSS